jgi:capping protein (actin filament) muscle Z-line, alpha
MNDENTTISEEEKIKIAANFLFHSPPGEFKEVFLDLRGLINDDRILKKSLNNINARYNQDQFIQCEIEDSTDPCIITEYNELPNGRYFDPRTKKSFKFDHLHFKSTEFEPFQDQDTLSEPWRLQLEKELTNYVKIHYKSAACSVFGSSDQGVISLVACTEAHKFQPSNFWNARWRARWAVSFQPSVKNDNIELSGVLKVQVHYYEDGNVQLVSQKELKDTINITDPEQTAKLIIKSIEKAENEYQNAVSENYQTMSETTFKALRRALPVTKSKIEWNRISSYKIANELKSSSTTTSS